MQGAAEEAKSHRRGMSVDERKTPEPEFEYGKVDAPAEASGTGDEELDGDAGKGGKETSWMDGAFGHSDAKEVFTEEVKTEGMSEPMVITYGVSSIHSYPRACVYLFSHTDRMFLSGPTDL